MNESVMNAPSPRNSMDATEQNVRRVVVRRSKEEKKVLRKHMKTSHVLLKHEGIRTLSEPTKSLVVSNGGLGNGVSREQLMEALKDVGEVELLVMPPHKPYAFVTYRSEVIAQKAHALLNGHRLLSGENAVTLYLSYVLSVPSEAEVCVSLPEGLVLLEDFVSREEESVLLASVDWTSTDEDSSAAQKVLKHRRVKHFGFEFRYDNNNVDKNKPLSAGIPVQCVSVLERCVRDGLVDALPDQLTVNQYQSGQGIPPHVDTHSAFEDSIMSLSLGAKAVMEFRHPDGRVVAVVMPERSLLVMKGESRYLWTHGITPRKFDVVPTTSDPQSMAATPPDLSGNHGNLTLSRRGVRTSFTFRRIRHAPCGCAFPSACDSQGAPSPSSPPSPPSLPRCGAAAAALEQRYVHGVYDAIATHFSGTRHSPWPRVRHFLEALPPGAALADVGCGNGKYLDVNPQLMAVGCDRSSALVQICAQRGYQAFVSDALSVPLRSASWDACISIAVIHHFSTQERRLSAVRELVRLLRPGGRALIYVWALEQEHDKQRSKYLKEPDGKEHAGNCSPAAAADGSHRGGRVPDGKLSVHRNRTAFTSQDLLVPWHLKDGRKGGPGQNGEQGTGKAGSKRTDSSHDSPTEDHRASSGPDSEVPGPGGEPGPGGVVEPGSGQPAPPPVFHRYYHVFQQGELEELCGRVAGVQIVSSYHDQGNWCVILEKH